MAGTQCPKILVSFHYFSIRWPNTVKIREFSLNGTVPLKGNCKQALFCVTEDIPYTWFMLSPMETKKNRRGANKDTATLGKVSSSGTSQSATRIFATVCKSYWPHQMAPKPLKKGKKGAFPFPSFSWQEIHCIYISPPNIFKHLPEYFYYKQK